MLSLVVAEVNPCEISLWTAAKQVETLRLVENITLNIGEREEAGRNSFRSGLVGRPSATTSSCQLQCKWARSYFSLLAPRRNHLMIRRTLKHVSDKQTDK